MRTPNNAIKNIELFSVMDVVNYINIYIQQHEHIAT